MRLVRRKETVASPYSGMDGVLGSTKPDAINLGRPVDTITHQIGPKLMYGGGLHSIVFGPSGVGKSTRLLLPNLLSMESGRSIVVIDTKGELAAVSAPFRRTLGKVVILNPFGVLCDVPGYKDLKSDGFNPLLHLDPAADSFNADADILADALVQVATEGNGRFFDSSARNLVAALLMLEVVEAQSRRRVPSLGYVRQNICAAMDGEHLEKLVDRMRECPVWGLQNKAAQFAQMRNSTADVIATAIDQTRALDDVEIVRDLKIGDFDMRELKKRPVTVYVILPPEHMDRHSKWLRLVVSAALRGVMRERRPGEPSILFALDEFYSLGHMQIISTLWAQTRGRGVQMMPFLQDLNQLKELYPKTYETFAGQSGAVITFGARDMVTAEWFSKRAGDKTELIESHTQNNSFSSGPGGASSSSSYSTSWNQTKVPFIPAHRFYEMREGTAYVWMAGLSETAALYVPAYHQVDTLNARARANPYHTGGQPPAEPVAPTPLPNPRFNGGGWDAAAEPVGSLSDGWN